jgi:hypothetical protein
MVTSNMNSSFDWLRQECLQIKSQRFHIFEALAPNDYFYELAGHSIDLSGDYADFLREFGWGKLFTDHRDAPVIAVYPLKEYRRHTCADGKTYVGFGDRGNKSFCFGEDAILSRSPLKVYMLKGNKANELHPSFSDWLKTSYELVQSKYSASKWQKIMHGPKPFTPEEMQIVEARKNFIWQHVGFTENGDAIFEVENRSTMSLPFLSIGVQGKGGSILIGGAWLKVSDIPPGTKSIITKDCYKSQLSAANFEAFPKPEPIPEKREAYWEFGIPK